MCTLSDSSSLFLEEQSLGSPSAQHRRAGQSSQHAHSSLQTPSLCLLQMPQGWQNSHCKVLCWGKPETPSSSRHHTPAVSIIWFFHRIYSYTHKGRRQVQKSELTLPLHRTQLQAVLWVRSWEVHMAGGRLHPVLILLSTDSIFQGDPKQLYWAPDDEPPRGAFIAEDNQSKPAFFSGVNLHQHSCWQMSCKKILEALPINLIRAAMLFKGDTVPRTHPGLKTGLEA